MNNYQKLQNEQFLIKMSKITKSWLWKDTGELFDFDNGKIIPKTKTGYKKLCEIVSPSFSKQYIINI